MKRSIVQGVAWVGGAMLLVRAVRYVALLILGGLLAPSDFGMFAALHVVIDGLALFQGFGIGQALIYRRERSDEATDTSFILSILIGLVLGSIAWLAAPAIEAFYAEEGMRELTRAGAIVLFAQSLRMIPLRLFEKALDFRQKLIPSFAGAVGYVSAAVVLALRGAGVWALLAGEIASVSLETAAYWWLSPWRPRWRFNPSIALQDLRFGWAVLGGSVLIFAFRNIDRITLSRIGGTDALGVYAFAYAIANLPATLFVRVLNTVLFPSYSSLADDREMQGRIFLKATRYIAGAGIAYCILLGVFGPELLGVFYGDRWADAGVFLRILAIFSLARALFALCGDLLVGTGTPRSFRAITALQLVTAGACLLVAVPRWGGLGVAVAMTMAAGVSVAAGWVAVVRVLGLRMRQIFTAVSAPVASALVIVLPFVWLLNLNTESSPAYVLIAAGCALLAYLVVWLAADARFRSDLQSLLKALRDRRLAKRSS